MANAGKKRGFGLLEAMIVIFVVSYGLMTAYSILSRGQRFSNVTANRIQAINIAREGVEAVTNIRDSNWLRFSADLPNCWKTKGYSQSCVGNSGIGHVIGSGAAATFVPYLSGGLWYLTGAANSGVYLDAEGLPYQTGGTFTASGCSRISMKSCKTIFTRQLTITHPNAPADVCGSGTGCMNVLSTVSWTDESSHSVNLETLLTNWKSKK